MDFNSHIKHTIQEAIKCNSVDGLYLQENAISYELYLLVEDLDELVQDENFNNLLTTLKEIANDGAYFAKNYSKYDHFVPFEQLHTELVVVINGFGKPE